ncbi:MAG TPA: hypothetical protein VD913_04980, partial [bacterium]|nr:hypothetical protein [bacterium]
EIAIEIEKSRIQSQIESAKRKILRPSALKALDDELQIRKREQSAVREKMRKLNEELDRLPADGRFEAAAREARNEALKALGARSEVREEVEETQEEILDQFDEGWLSREEQGLFSRIRDNRKIVEIYQKLSRGEGANPKELKLLMDSLKDENPLALILGRRLQGGDWVVNWQVSGVGEGGVNDGLGVKQFNTLFGAEGYNAFKRMELDPIVIDAMESVFGIRLTRILLKDFKGIIPIVKPRSPQLSNLTPQEFKELLNKAEKQIKKNATKWLRSKLQGRGKELLEYKIDLKERESDFEDDLEADVAGLNLLSIKAGLDQVKESSNQARLEAVIHSAFARDLPGGIYSKEAYKNFIRETIALRNDLNQKDVLGPIFEDFNLSYKDSQGKLRNHSEKVIRKDVAIYLRKKIPWDVLPAAMKEVFKTVSNYRRAQEFFNRLSIQDYFIRWPLEFDKAQKEAEEVLEAIQFLNKKVSAGEGVSGENAVAVKMIVERFIMTDSRNRAVTSRLSFHGRAPPMKGKPVYAFMDIIGLGAELGQVLTAQIGLIDQLIQQGEWEEAGNIQRNSGAPSIEKKIMMQDVIRQTYKRVLGPEADKRPLLIDVGGDEVNLVFNAEGLSPDLLNTLWFEIRRAVLNESGFQIRIGIESDVSSYRTHFEGLENAEVYAHMQALRTGDFVTELAKGIEEDIKKSVLM